ncbi:hypothetical protein [Burkholderia sp. WP9]|uniref:hypothetical protein n=1 Tax=Burkholderia sp. WP9 TaxID=1500263 RepID=UPI000B811152|nr:hypothetical protein [Burkholderia sp. WP9]
MTAELPDELPLPGIRVTAVGNTIAVKTGPSQWHAIRGELLLDLVAEIKGNVVFLESAPRPTSAVFEAEEWYELANSNAFLQACSAPRTFDSMNCSVGDVALRQRMFPPMFV